MDMQTPSWGFSSAHESGVDAANQPRSKSVEILEGSSISKNRDPHDEEQATVQTRSKSTAVKEESKKRKSVEPQRDHEAAKRPKSDEPPIKPPMKTQASIFGLQAAPDSAEEHAAVLRESMKTEERWSLVYSGRSPAGTFIRER